MGFAVTAVIMYIYEINTDLRFLKGGIPLGEAPQQQCGYQPITLLAT